MTRGKTKEAKHGQEEKIYLWGVDVNCTDQIEFTGQRGSGTGGHQGGGEELLGHFYRVKVVEVVSG